MGRSPTSRPDPSLIKCCSHYHWSTLHRCICALPIYFSTAPIITAGGDSILGTATLALLLFLPFANIFFKVQVCLQPGSYMFHDLIELWNFEANKRAVNTGGIVTCRNIGFVLLTAVIRRRFTFSGVNENIQLIFVKYIIFKIVVLLAAVIWRCFTFSGVNENIQFIKMPLKSLHEGQHFLLSPKSPKLCQIRNLFDIIEYRICHCIAIDKRAWQCMSSQTHMWTWSMG